MLLIEYKCIQLVLEEKIELNIIYIVIDRIRLHKFGKDSRFDSQIGYTIFLRQHVENNKKFSYNMLRYSKGFEGLYLMTSEFVGMDTRC